MFRKFFSSTALLHQKMSKQLPSTRNFSNLKQINIEDKISSTLKELDELTKKHAFANMNIVKEPPLRKFPRSLETDIDLEKNTATEETQKNINRVRQPGC